MMMCQACEFKICELNICDLPSELVALIVDRLGDKDYLHKDFFQKKAIISNQKSKENQEVKLNFRKIGLVGHRTLLNIELLTGKYHQIRAQLASIGFPIAGDVLYGGELWKREGIGLHASALQFDHPETKERITIKSDWDIDSIPI